MIGGTPCPRCGAYHFGPCTAFQPPQPPIDLDAHRPHAVAHVLCRACGELHLSVHPVAADPARLQCPACLQQDSEVHLTEPGECTTCDGVRDGR